MGFKKFLVCLLLIFSFASLSAILCAAEPQNPSEPAIDEQTEAQLITEARSIQERLGLEPGNAGLYFELSNIYAELFDRTRKKSARSNEWLIKSANALEKTVMIDPAHKVAHYNLGVIYKRQEKMEAAREEIKKAIRVADPATDAQLLTACWMQIGSIYAEQGFYQEAEESFLKASEYDYGNPEIREAINEVREKKANTSSRNADFGAGMLPGSMMGSSMASGQAGAGYEGTGSSNNQAAGLAQAIPYLAQMVSQKFTGNKDGGQDVQDA